MSDDEFFILLDRRESAAAFRVRWDEWQCTPPIDPRRHRQIVREMALDGCKWDAQVGDVTALAPFVLSIPFGEWENLKALAEELAHELNEVEGELVQRPELWRILGLPSRLRRALDSELPWTPASARTMRFDFHPTPDGWRISEVNSDVPGGYNEASIFAKLMAAEFRGHEPAGDPLAILADAMAKNASGCIALLSAPGFAEDLQVAAGLAKALRARNITVLCVGPGQIVWENGEARIATRTGTYIPEAIFRFFQGEWLSRLPVGSWERLFRGGLTPTCNPAGAVLTESKRLPLLWPVLRTATPTWQRLLPEVRPARHALLASPAEWLLKAAYSNNGDTVLGGDWTSPRDYRWAAIATLARPAQWLVQRRFESLLLKTPTGFMRPCIGVYVIDGVACGIYGRLTAKSWIDYTARDVAVCIRD